MTDKTDDEGPSKASEGEEEDEKSLFFGRKNETDSSEDSGRAGEEGDDDDDREDDEATEEKAKRTESGDTAPILTAVVAFIVIVTIGTAAYFILKPAASNALTGTITGTGQCNGSTTGVQAEMLDSAGKALAKSPITEKQNGASCDLNFAMSLPTASNYQLAVLLPPSVAQSAGTNQLSGPKYTFDQLAAKKFHLTLAATDFGGPPSSAPTPAPAPPAQGGGSGGGGNGGGGGGSGGGGNGNGP